LEARLPRRRAGFADGDFHEQLDGARRRDPACLRALHDAVVRQVGAYLRANGAVDPAGSTNEVLFRALVNLHRFEGDADRYRAWVLTIAHHLLIDERRARGRRPCEVPLPDDVDTLAAADDPAATVEVSEATREVLDALADLPELQRQVITLRWVADLSLADVAAILGCRVGAVKALQHRGVETLRRRAGAVTMPVDLTLAPS
jgi:RNA polymerase sigma-70 factor (ECF subfamily)